MELTQEKLKELLVFDEDIRRFRALVQRGTIVVGDIVGSVQVNGYRVISIANKKYYEHRLVWLYVYGSFPEGNTQIDHINGDRADNSISNLRGCSNSENTQNVKIKSTNTSGFKGVTWHKKSRKWMVRIRNKNISKPEYLGLFITKVEASNAYEARAKELHGEFYRDTRKENND